MNARVQIDVLMRVKASHRFGNYSNLQNKLIIENYFDEIMSREQGSDSVRISSDVRK